MLIYQPGRGGNVIAYRSLCHSFVEKSGALVSFEIFAFKCHESQNKEAAWAFKPRRLFLLHLVAFFMAPRGGLDTLRQPDFH